MVRISVGSNPRVFLQGLVLSLFLTASPAQANPIDVRVMTQNLYFGADLTAVALAPDVPSLIGAVTVAYGNVLATNPAARIEQVANEITAARPDIVGLQEAVLWRTRTPSVFTGFPGPEVVAFDFVQMLLNDLGPTYALAVSNQSFDEAAPGILGGVLSDIRLTGRDAILVRTDRPTSEFSVLGTGGATYSSFVSFPVAGGAGGTVNSLRGYAYADIGLDGTQFRITTTQLEPDVAPINVAQGNQLIGTLGGVPGRQIAIGDFNSRADGLGTAAYANMLAAGFRDAWLEQGVGNGYTCCEAANLLNDPSSLDQRIDFIFHSDGIQTLSVDVVGGAPGDRVDGLWPSDHAGVVATLRFVPEPGTITLALIALGALALLGVLSPKIGRSTARNTSMGMSLFRDSIYFKKRQ